MEEDELIRMIGSAVENTAQRRWNCPSDRRIAAYLENGLEPKERLRLEAHLADCDFCLAMVGALVRQQRTPELSEAPADLVDKAAYALPANTGRRISRRWVVVPAFITIVVVAVVLLGLPQHRGASASMSAPAVEKPWPPVALLQPPSQSTEEHYVRKLTTPGEIVEVLEPQSESVVLRERLRFRWKAVANVAYYELRVANAEGDLLWQGQESNTTAQVPPDLPVRPGAYFVWVRAFLHDGRTIKSDPVPFTISK
jgi:hypothetical protein